MGRHEADAQDGTLEPDVAVVDTSKADGAVPQGVEANPLARRDLAGKPSEGPGEASISRGYICYICGESGHTWKDCPSPIRCDNRPTETILDGKGNIVDSRAHGLLDGADPRTLLKHGMDANMIADAGVEKSMQSMNAAKAPMLSRKYGELGHGEFDCARCGRQTKVNMGGAPVSCCTVQLVLKPGPN